MTTPIRTNCVKQVSATDIASNSTLTFAHFSHMNSAELIVGRKLTNRRRCLPILFYKEKTTQSSSIERSLFNSRRDYFLYKVI